jgi:PST family polysaccharide transporter
VLQVAVVLATYRHLPATSMGAFEWALLLVVLLSLLAELGLSEALVQARDAGDAAFDTAFWLNLGLGLSLAAGVGLGAPRLAPYLGGDQPREFARLAQVLALILPCAAVSGVFRARLQRRLDFAAVALSEVLSVVVFAAVTLALLVRLGVRAVAVASVLRELALLASLACSAQWRPRFHFAWSALCPCVTFGLHLTGSRLVGYVNTYVAAFVIYPLLGSQSLGYYKLAERLTVQPLTRLATTIFRVSLPTFAVIQDDDRQLQQGYLASVQTLLLALGPPLVALFMLAPQLLTVVGNLPALAVLRWLAIATLLKVVGTMVGSMFMAKGKASWQLHWSLFSLAVLAPAMYVAVPYGVEGMAAAVALTSVLFLVVSQHLANRLIGLPARAYVTALARPALAVLTVAVLLALACPVLPSAPVPALVLAGLIAALAALLGVRLFAWEVCQGAWRSVRGGPTSRPA